MMKLKLNRLNALWLLLIVIGSFACKKSHDEVIEPDITLQVDVYGGAISPGWFPEGTPVGEALWMVAKKVGENDYLPLVIITGFKPEAGFRYVLKVKKTGNVVPGTTTQIETDFSLVAIVSKEKIPQ
ncbi:DUF4377 domain-containing protein [Chitinophaga sp. Cy-1792]|uniref:DUF4377 domain-containing protein n=1 Tax=Chitinophaga sp. Cy-1792 TaxID=2608339 RepID=UPI00141F7138|nr:DUF4377 domain-containing protein [Chitinophaga sp. Cy-1792]NIG54542.1 hypothetical protein [Chitinophaga sp. Cy-1792]